MLLTILPLFFSKRHKISTKRQKWLLATDTARRFWVISLTVPRLYWWNAETHQPNKKNSKNCWIKKNLQSVETKKKERENKYLPEKKKSTVTVISLCSGFWKISGFEKVFLWEFSGCTRKLTRSHCLKWWWRPIIWLMLTRARDSCTARRLTFLHNRRTLFLPVIIRAWTVEMLPRKDFSRLWWKLKPTFFTYFWNFTKFQGWKHFSWFFGEFSSFFQF